MPNFRIGDKVKIKGRHLSSDCWYISEENVGTIFYISNGGETLHIDWEGEDKYKTYYPQMQAGKRYNRTWNLRAEDCVYAVIVPLKERVCLKIKAMRERGMENVCQV